MSTPLFLAAGAIDASELARFWAALAVLLATARGMGLLARRAGQPAVIGELAAGVLLGPTLLGRIAPGASDWLFGGDASSIMLQAVAWLGVVLLLAMTGFETDLGMLKRLGRAAGWTSLTSLVIPFAMGLGLAAVLPRTFIGESGGGVAFVLFMGVALAISALPVVAKVLREMGMVGGPVGQITLAAGMVNDLVGWVLLGLVAGLARTGAVDPASLAMTVAGVVGFLLVAATLGQRAVDGLLRAAASRDNSSTTVVGAAVVVILIAGAITQVLGVEAVLGAFIAGILLSRSPIGGRRVEHEVSSLTDGFLAPIFFATAGLQVDLLAIIEPSILLWTIAVIAVATVGKVLGGIMGGLLGGMGGRDGLLVGVGLNARGALEIVVASIGLSLGVLSEVAYSVVVVMAVVTSMMAPPALVWLARRFSTADDEDQQVSDASPVLQWRHALLPTRGGDSSARAGVLLDRILPADSRITALTVHPEGQPGTAGRAAAKEVAAHVLRRITWRERATDVAANAILDEARLGYDVLAVGASAETPDEVVSPTLADLLLAAPAPVIVHRGSLVQAADEVPRRVIATVDGSAACDLARDVAARIAASHGLELELIHVLQLDGVASGMGPESTSARRAVDRLEGISRAATDRAADLGADTALLIRTGSDVASAVADEVTHEDLLVIGTEVRSAGGEAVLGATAEELLLHSEADVLVVAIPPAVRGMT